MKNKGTKKNNHIRNVMKISILEGIFAQVYSGLVSIGSSFITKFAVLLNASPLHFSLISAISQLSQLFQLSGYLISRKSASRKSKCVWYAFWGRLLNIFLLIPVIINPSPMAIILFLSVLMVSAALQNISGNMWTAWIADEIPLKIRGRFFSKRMQILMIYGFSTAWLISFFIDLFEKEKSHWKSSIISMINAENLFTPTKNGNLDAINRVSTSDTNRHDHWYYWSLLFKQTT